MCFRSSFEGINETRIDLSVNLALKVISIHINIQFLRYNY